MIERTMDPSAHPAVSLMVGSSRNPQTIIRNEALLKHGSLYESMF